YRSDFAARIPLLRALDTLEASHVESHELEIGALDDDAARTLIASLLGREAPVDALARESGGSPFFLVELCLHASAHDGKSVAAGHINVQDMLHGRVAELSEPARRLLEVMGAAGQPIPIVVAGDASRLGDQTHEYLEQLRRAKLVRIEGLRADDLVEPYHDRIRETVNGDLPVDNRRAVHGLLGDAY